MGQQPKMFMVHYSLTTKKVKFHLFMKDYKWSRRLMFISLVSHKRRLLWNMQHQKENDLEKQDVEFSLARSTCKLAMSELEKFHS